MAVRRPTAALPASWDPQLATLVKTAPDGDEWLHEIKFDGYRIAARLDRGTVRLLSRRGNDWSSTFPEVRDAVAKLPARQALLDGEVAAVLPDGRTSFQALQRAGDVRGRPVLTYFVFDLLHLDGADVGRLPLDARKETLEALLRKVRGPTLLTYSSHVVGGGRRFLAAACERGLEGIVSKRRDRPYEPGRHGAWVKAKCWQRQEVVIGAFTDPEGSRAGLGALLVGVHDVRGDLVFAGKVGTGFTHKVATELRAALDRLEQSTPAFVNPPKEARRWRAHWVKPELVAEVAFAEWTDDGRMRHPSFQGLRADKRPREVVREVAVPVAAVADDPPARRAKPAARRKAPAQQPARDYQRPPRSREQAIPGTGTPLPRGSASARATVAGVSLSHPERILYPEDRITKLDLARYYESVAEWIVPHVAGRPLTLVRCPNGLGSCFYMKHTRTWHPPDVIRQVRIREQKKTGDYAVVDAIAGVVALAQMNILEIHTWNATVDHLETPDRVVIDLDPGPEVAWKDVVATARVVRAALEALGLRSFVKTTGGKGLHVVAPFVPQHDWDTCLAFARGVAEAIEREDATRYSTSLAKRGREDKILLDYLRNNRGSTSVAAFSTRARPGGAVSMPIDWDELAPRLAPDQFTLRNAAQRLRRLRIDPWREYWTLRQRLTARALRAVGASSNAR